MDKLTKERRSWNMSRIKGRNTKPELLIREALFLKGFRYRLHAKLPGKPDLIFSSRKIVLFVNGCFWHRHEGCKNFVLPKTNTAFWEDKINGNVKRDSVNYAKLIESGWKPIVIWECKIEVSFDQTINKVIQQLNYDRTG